jgi:hypothetical protein
VHIQNLERKMENSTKGRHSNAWLPASANVVFKTSCTMHNWLLEVDGLDDK